MNGITIQTVQKVSQNEDGTVSFTLDTRGWSVYNETGVRLGFITVEDLTKQIERSGYKIIKLNNDKTTLSPKEEQ